MKLSSKEMIILSVFLSIVIIVAGLFLFIMPEYDKIEPNKNNLQAAKDERDQVYAVLTREETIDQEIQDAIDQANTTSLYFYDDMTTYEADVLVREILEATNMSTDSLSLSNFATSTLSVTDYVSAIVTYPLKDYSGFKSDNIQSSDYPISYDEEGKIIVPEAYLKKYGEEQALTEYLTALLSTQTQTVGSITVSFTIKGTRANFLNFLNYVADLEKATYIGGTTVAYTGNSGASAAEDEEGEASANTNTDQLLGINAEIAAPISMTFYCITPMQPQESAEAEAEPEPEAEPAA